MREPGCRNRAASGQRPDYIDFCVGGDEIGHTVKPFIKIPGLARLH